MRFAASSVVTLATVLSLANPIFAVNCDGASGCRFAAGRVVPQLTNYITSGIDTLRHYDDGEHIACQRITVFLFFRSHICAFMQNEGGATGITIARLALEISNYGCHQCGSVPYDFPPGSGGGLTINVVHKGACKDGLC